MRGLPGRNQATISPRARRVAEELGIEWRSLRGTGRTGRIRERDVRAAAAALGADRRPSTSGALRSPTPLPQSAILGSQSAIPPALTPIRRLIAQRLTESRQTTAAVTLTTEVDAAELVELHDKLKASLAPRGIAAPTYTDLMLKLTATALGEHPLLNASWEAEGIRLHTEVHLAVAVDTEAGVLAPVIRDVPAKSLRRIAAESAALAEKARTRALVPDDLTGGTFTVTNLGMYGIDAFTPIINLPQCAILGVGRIVRKPAVHNDQVVPREMMTLSLTFDHRVVDGGPAARFLNRVREYVEDPYLWLTE